MGNALHTPGHPVGAGRRALQEPRSRALAEPVSEVFPSSENVPFLVRLGEIVIAAVALLLSLPAMAVIALLIRCDTPGPVLFRQQRLGLNGKPFTFLKFRTHYADSRERFPEWCNYQFSEEEVSQVRLQVEDDPRVTPRGRWLRRTSLDELPNFWHVLTGEMALVGPRPEMVEMLPYYKGEALLKFSVRPGITGYAQVFGRGDLKFHETIAYDLRYVREKSFRTDLMVILRTIRMIVAGVGAY
ncbi:MAG: sugar transferase [Bryobacteraceae bacterium]|nr:sugar transferase [Bryobacterales bacterium]NUN00442.1 sugar transferase [Bryobacteraceae bacterium]